ncbi:hypothetical protein JCGZ_05232 [Jatropha curcas]|uniref:Uncharacterized protein n=1 Tax=Jatropha curcas TaxID=180498 RepID=A0A067KNR7_JATCU|nr:hypothetical protein JCGZ_05232 [Jatropha curcas]
MIRGRGSIQTRPRPNLMEVMTEDVTHMAKGGLSLPYLLLLLFLENYTVVHEHVLSSYAEAGVEPTIDDAGLYLEAARGKKKRKVYSISSHAAQFYTSSADPYHGASGRSQSELSAKEISLLRAHLDEQQERQLTKLRAHVMQMSRPQSDVASSHPPTVSDPPVAPPSPHPTLLISPTIPPSDTAPSDEAGIFP